MKAIIFARSINGIIGVCNRIPWNYPGDLRRFRRFTAGGTVIMGRRTWEAIGRPLPNRINIVVSSGDPPGAPLVARSLQGAIALADSVAVGRRIDIFFIGGLGIYEAAMEHVDLIDETLVPIEVDDSPHLAPVRAPMIDETEFEYGPGWFVHDDEPDLRCRRWVRKGTVRPYDLADNRRLQEAGSLSRGGK